MDTLDILTPREKEIAYEIAKGAICKEIADKYCISEYTVRNHIQNIYDKTGIRKCLNSLASWFICTKHHIALSLLLIVSLQIFYGNQDNMVRQSRSRTRTSTRARRRGDEMADDELFLMDF